MSVMLRDVARSVGMPSTMIDGLAKDPQRLADVICVEVQKLVPDDDNHKAEIPEKKPEIKKPSPIPNPE